MLHVKNYETMLKFVKVMQRKLHFFLYMVYVDGGTVQVLF